MIWEELIARGMKETPILAPVDTALVSGTATAAIETGVPDRGGWFTYECSVAFNVLFGGASVANPSAHYAYGAGSRRVWLTKDQTHFKIKPAANGFLTSGLSSR